MVNTELYEVFWPGGPSAVNTISSAPRADLTGKRIGILWDYVFRGEEIFPILEKSESTSEEIIATFTEHVAVQLSENIQHHSSQKVLVTGGGAFNTYLIELLQQKTKAQIILPQKNLIEFKEALIFGFLGVLRLENEINVLASVTGASKNHSSGKIFEV